MASSSDPNEGLSRTLSTLGAAIIFLLGLFFVVLSFLLIKDADFQAMNNMIAADAAWVGQPALTYTIDKAAVSIIVIGFLAMVSACVGCSGAQLEMHNLICGYFMCLVVLGIWFLLTFVSVLNFDAILVPIAERQAMQFCNVTEFYTFKAQLGCTFKASRPGGACLADCQNRVALLKEMDGCSLLETMCHSFDWQPVGPGLCLTAGAVAGSQAMPPTWQSQVGVLMSSQTCQHTCNEHVACSASSFNAVTSACYLAMRLAPTTQGNWTKLAKEASAVVAGEAASPVTAADGQVGFACTKKDQPTVVTKAGSFARLLAWLTGVSAIISSLAMCCTCSLLFTTGTRRKGKKGACPLLHKMLCPCCIGSDKRRLSDQFEAVESEDEEEELSE